MAREVVSEQGRTSGMGKMDRGGRNRWQSIQVGRGLGKSWTCNWAEEKSLVREAGESR